MTFSKKKTVKPVLLLPVFMVSVLTACGGDSGVGVDTGNVNLSPVVDAGSAQVVLGRSEVTVEATASDTDGSVASYAWTQTAGPDVTLDAADESAMTFTAPAVTSTDTLEFEVTVTDSDGATATDTVEVDVIPAVSLSAKVYDGPLAGATVTVTVGDSTYTTTADENGAFVLDIGSPDPGAMITITATGSAEQADAELISIAGSFGTLFDSAGDDGVLDGSESGSVDVTNLSTAKAVLMVAANDGNPISDDSTLAVMEANVSGEDLLYLATVIKLVIDGGHELPEGADSTLELVSDRSLADDFVEDVAVDAPEAFDTIYDEMINDPELLAAFTQDNVPAQLFTLYVSSNNDKSGTYRAVNRGITWMFDADGTGTRSDADYASAPFTWTVSEGEIVVTYDTPLASNGWCSHPDGAAGWTYYCESTTTATTIALLFDGATADTLLLSDTGETNYPDDPGLAQAIEMTGGLSNLGLQAAAAIPFTADEVPGRWITSATGRAHPDVAPMMLGLLDSGFLEFVSGGAGQRMATDYSPAEAFTWSVEDGVLKVAYTGGDTVHYYRLRRDGNVYDTLALVTRSEGGSFSDAGLMLEVEVDRLPLLALEDVPARYTLFEMANDFSIRLDVGGTGANEFYTDAGEPFDDYLLGWDLREDYVVQMSYYWDEGGTDNQCADITVCEIWMDRLWYPAAYDDATGRVYLLEVQQEYVYDPAAPYKKGALERYQPSVRYWGRHELAADGGIAKMSAPGRDATSDPMKGLLAEPQWRNR